MKIRTLRETAFQEEGMEWQAQGPEAGMGQCLWNSVEAWTIVKELE